MNSILVIGDSCIDSYTYCKVKRLAPDKPVPVLEVERVERTPGMAYNTFQNVKSLTISCDLLTNGNWEQIVKNRYVDVKSNHMFVRVDEGEQVPAAYYEDKIFEYDTIIISDYDKGFLLKKDIQYICSNHDQVFLDTKKPLGKWAKDAKFIKINEDEYQKSKDYIDGSYFFKKIEDLKTYYQSLDCRYQDYSLELAYLDIIELNANNYFDGTLHAHQGVTPPSFDSKMTKHTTKQKLSLDGLDFKPRRSKQFAFN